MSDWLKEYANENGLPIMNQGEFEHHTDRIGKEQFRLDLAEYIANNRPVFPLKEISEDEERQGEHAEGKESKCSVFKELGQRERGAREQQSEVQEKGTEAL